MGIIKEDDLLSKISYDKKLMRQWSYSSKSTFYFGRDCAQEQKDLPLKLKPRVWSKPLTLVDGEKMMGWVAANYLFCVPTIAAATAEVPTALKGG